MRCLSDVPWVFGFKEVPVILAKLSVLAKRPTIPDGFSKAELPIVVNVLYKKSRITNAQNSRKNKCP